MPEYQAFISYKHNKMLPVAGNIAKALRAYARPIFTPPPLIFRDEDYLVPNNSLPKLIRQGLHDSQFLILIASPAAAASPWVQEEIMIWCEELKRQDQLIIVLTEGEISFDFKTKKLNWEQTDALSGILSQFIDEIPLFIDFRDVQRIEQLDLADPDFKKAINAITARLRGIAPDDMTGDEVRVYRNNKRIRNTGIIVLIALALIAIWFGFEANKESKRATIQQKIAEQKGDSLQHTLNTVDSARKEAIKQTQIAKDSSESAQRSRIEAEKQRDAANLATIEAKRQTKEARSLYWASEPSIFSIAELSPYLWKSCQEI
jgi:hypothetical protein